MNGLAGETQTWATYNKNWAYMEEDLELISLVTIKRYIKKASIYKTQDKLVERSMMSLMLS